MDKWSQYSFSKFVQINPVVKLMTGNEYSYVEMKDLQDGLKYCMPSGKRVFKGGSKFTNNDTLFARITPCLENGKICKVRDLMNNVGFGSTEFLVFRGKEDISDNDFIYYLSRWEVVRNFAISNFEGTSGRQRVAKGVFDNLLLKLPPLTEQAAIAEVLSSLDDKIDLLHRQNQTLEQLAETLFRQWFIEEAEEGWERKILDDVVTVKGGSTPSTKLSEFWDGDICWATPKDLSNHSGVFLLNTERRITSRGLERISSGLLPQGIVLLSSRAPIGYLAITDTPLAINQGFIAILCNKGIQNYFVYLWCKLNVEEIKNAGNGSVFQEISKSIFRNLKIQVPPSSLLEKFNEIISPLFDKIKNNQLQIRTLTQLRDTLLPRLMSGEVRVKYR